MNYAQAPFARPSQACRRFTYETGQRSPSPQEPGVVGQGVAPQYAWEEFALAAETSCWMTDLEVTIDTNEGAPQNGVYVLLYDVAATPAALASVIAGTFGAARYTYGPIPLLGMMVREPQEFFQLRNAEGHVVDEFLGAPFDSGVLIALSSTPRLLTRVNLDLMSVVFRGKY